MQTNQLLKKYSFFICLAVFQLLPFNVFSQSSEGDSVVIWSEDFTGYDEGKFPSHGKNATYSDLIDAKTASFQVSYTCDGNSPILKIIKNSGNDFVAHIPLYHATGDFQLTFYCSHPEDLVVTALNKRGNKDYRVNVSRVGKSFSKYSIKVQEDIDTLRLAFKNGNDKRNIDVDNFLLVASSTCRPQKPKHNISYPKDTVSIIWSEDHTFPVLENAEGLPIRYWSYDSRVASIDSEGKVTPHSLGYTTISAIYAGDDTYGYEEASYILHIDRRVPDDEIFFEDFNRCVSVGGRDGNINSSYSGNAICDNPHSKGGHMAYKCIAVGQSTYWFQIKSLKELDAHDGILTFLSKAQKGNTTGKVTLANGGTLTKDDFNVNKTDWSLITISFKNATANSVFTISGDEIYIDSVSIRAFPSSIQLNVGKTGYSSMYYGNHSLIVPEGVSAYTMKIVDGNIDDSHRYVAGDVIPKGTGVVVKAAEGSYNLSVTTDKGYDDSENNQLRGTDYRQMTTGGDVYYMLAAPDNKPVGYYWAARKGGAFMNGAHKAYLALSVGSNAKSGYGFSIDTSTSINTLTTNRIDDKRCYNIMGQRINESTYKGIILKNGKKFIKR